MSIIYLVGNQPYHRAIGLTRGSTEAAPHLYLHLLLHRFHMLSMINAMMPHLSSISLFLIAEAAADVGRDEAAR